METKTIDNNKKLIKIVGIVAAVVVVLIVALVILLSGGGSKDNKEELETTLTNIGKSFYENFYYEQIGSSADERSQLLSKFTTVGIKVDLENLERYNDGEFADKISNFKNSKTDEKCNKVNTKVVIYPKSPYGKTDYTIETELDCGFETENK